MSGSAVSIALGRSHAMGAAESGMSVGGRAPAPPAPTRRREAPLRRCAAASGPQTRCLLASFSRYACLSCSLSVRQAASKEAQTCVRGPPAAPSWLAGAVGPQALPPAPRLDLLVDPVAPEASSRRALRSVAGRCIVVTVVGLPVQCVTGPGRPRLGVQRPGPGPAVAHGYPGARRCASSAVRFAWCLAVTPIWGF